MTAPMNPGSDVARRAGCKCDMIANGYGKGAFVSRGGEVLYDVNPKCPLHAPKPLTGTPCS